MLCGIPVGWPPKYTLEYSRQNGRFLLRVIGHPDYGLPFGQDRLLLIWIATKATWQKSREIRFRSAAAILETFGLPKDGRYYKRLIEGLGDLARECREILSGARGISLVSIGAETCELAARLRATHDWIRTPDAIQVATALQHGAELIVTNDDRCTQGLLENPPHRTARCTG